MEIAENIFHFNDKKALENQSPETSKAIFSHFWNSLQENTLAQEFLPKEVFQVHKPYHFFSFHPAYAASVLYKTLDSLEVFVRTVGLDKWELKIHASSHGRERFAVPKLESPAIMDQGPFPTHLVYKLDSALAEALQESEVHTGAKRRRTSEHEGNQKTPSFLNEKLRQSIKKVASDPNKQTTGSMFGNMHVYGGTTDVGLHTGGKKRNTAAPLVFSVISTMFQLAGRPSDEFKSLVAIYFISFLDGLPKVNIYDARAIDRYIIVMREARPFIEELQNEKLKQKILQKLKMYHSQLYSVSYGPTQELRLCAFSEILKELSAPEFPKATPLPQISSSESKLEMSWREAKVNLMWIDMHSKVFSGSLQEAWVQLHALNVRFWMAASTLNQNSSPECVLELKKDLERLSRIVKVALDAANEGRFIMSVVIRSYELLAAIICFCFAHREVEINHEWFSKYAPAFDPKNLERLVLDDKMAIDAAGQVRAFLEMRAKGIVPFRNHKDNMSLAKDFASNQSERAKKNRQVYQNYLRKSRQKIHKRWQKIQGRQRQLQILDAKLQRAQIDLVELTSILSQEERKAAFEYSFGTSYNIALERVEAAQTDVSRLEREIKSIERPPANLVFSLPEEENAAELLLFFMFMDDDFRHLAELGHQAECLLWHRKDIPKAEEKGQPLLSWLGTSVSCGLLGNGISQGMIRPFCPSARDITTPTPDIRSYNMRTGVFFPKVHNFCFGWEGTSPFKDLCQDSVRLFTENFDPKWTGHEPDKNTEFTMDVFLAAHPSPFRENIAPAKPEMKPNWLTREQYNAFASLRVTGRTQVRSLLNALFSNLLPLGNPCVHILIQQVLFQFGASDWKTDLEPEWNGLEAMDKFWRREVDELRHAPKSFERLLLAGIVSGYYSQFNTSFEEIAIQVSVIFDQWANDISLENRSIDIIAKQACFYGFALLCLAPVRMTFQCRRELLRLLVLYRDRLLLSQDKGDRVLEQAVMKVMGTKWPCYSEADSISDSLLTSLIQTVVESAPSDLTWSAVQYANVKSTACFEAVDSERLFSINLNNGVVLVNGKPRSFLPQSITSDNLFVRHFGAANPEVSIEGVHHYRTTHKVQDYFFYDFVIDANRQLHIFEFDSRKGFEDYERLELLDPDNIPFQPHLANQHSHWINEKKQYLLLRDKSIQSHRISFAMRPGKLLSVPPAFCFAPIEEIFQKEGQFDTVFAGLTPFVKLLSDAGFEEPRFVLVMTYQNRTIKYSLPRYGLSFTQTDQGIRSEDFKGYNVTQNQQLADTLPGFKSFLLLSSSDGENMLAVPCGEVLEQGTIKMQQDWVSARTFHTFRIHRRFHHLQPSTTLGRLHLSCLYASTGCLIPDRRTGKTGTTIAVELLRQCFQNFCFSNEELAKLRNLSKHSGLSSTLRLLVWCIYRWSRSLQVPYKRAMEEENFLNLDKMASEEYHIMQTGPYLTSAEEQIIFCRTTMKESIEEDEDSSISCIESKIADYIRVIEMERFQSLLRKEKRHCKSEFPITISTIGHRGAEGGRIREQVQADLQESYQAYCHLHVKKVISWDTELSEISREVCNKRESIETRVLDTLNMAVSTGQPFDLFAGSIGKFVSRDLIHIIYDVSLIRRLQRREDGSRWVLGIQSQVNDWALLCVLEDKICRLQRFSEQQKDIELIQEVQCARIWKPREYPRWLAFEVEQQLQIRPEQFKTVDQLLQNPRGSVIQLNMGTGKTRVMIPMLVLELSRQRRKLVRITVLPSILQEALLFYQQCLVASVQHTKLFTLPFIRDNEIDECKVKILDEEVRRCHIYGGCLIMTPQDRNSLLLKQHDSNIYLAKLSQELIFDIIDESDAILEPSFQLVYAMGTKQDLPSRPTRCKMLQSLFSILSLGECTALLHLLADPTAFHREDTDAGCFRNLRVLKLSSEDRNHFTRSIAECFVRNPRPGFEWLKKLKKQEDIEFLVTMISDPEFRDTSVVISGSPLFTLFKDDILAARGFLAYGILLHCLEARWGVSYGLRHLRDDDTQMAVPYSASDTPKRRAEFSHPDVGIAYTNLSYLHVGLTKSQFRMALDLLDTKGLSVKLSTYAVWIERVKADVPTFELDQFDKYEKVDPSNHAQFEVMHRRLNRCMEVVFFG